VGRTTIRDARAVRSRRLTAALALVGAVVAGTASAGDRPMRVDARSVATRASMRARPPERVVTSDVTIGTTRVVRVQQRIGGLDVLGADAVVLVGAEGAERTLSDSTATLAPPAVTVPDVSALAAVDAARREAGVRELGDPAPEANLAIQRVRRGTRLVWVVELSGARPVTEIESIVDAGTGRVVRRRTLEMHDTGTARIYDPSPPVQQQSSVGLSDEKDRDSPLLDSLRLPVTLERIDQGSRCLDGMFVRVVVSDRRRPVCDDALDFSDVTRSQVGFEALMAYFHLDRLQAYVQSLGFTDILNGRFPVVANAFRADNSAFFPRLDTIRLGRGGVDDGEDADIIVHEYGHAIQDAQVPRFGRSRAAMSMGEGFGDYLAAVASSELSPDTTRESDVCIGEWDAISFDRAAPICLRRVDRLLTLPQAQRRCSLEIHCVGTVWSSLLWGLREAIGEDASGNNIVDRVVLASHELQQADVSFEEAGHALGCADEMLYPSGAPDDCVGAHQDAIHTALVERAILAS
jgi:hypothetical protein